MAFNWKDRNRGWHLLDLSGDDRAIAEAVLARYLTGRMSDEEWAAFDAAMAEKYGFTGRGA